MGTDTFKEGQTLCIEEDTLLWKGLTLLSGTNILDTQGIETLEGGLRCVGDPDSAFYQAQPNWLTKAAHWADWSYYHNLHYPAGRQAGRQAAQKSTFWPR